MQIKSFIVTGENIHCTRVLKRGGKVEFVKTRSK